MQSARILRNEAQCAAADRMTFYEAVNFDHEKGVSLKASLHIVKINPAQQFLFFPYEYLIRRFISIMSRN